MFKKNLFRKSCRLWDNVGKNIVERGWPQMAIWRMRIACWIPKATNTHSGCVILIAFSLQHWLHERALMLFTRILLVLFCLFFLSCNFLLRHLLRSLARVPILLGKLSKIWYNSTKLIFFCNSASYFIPLSLKRNLRFRVTQSDSETFTWYVFVLTLRWLMSYIYIYIWSTHSWCF